MTWNRTKIGAELTGPSPKHSDGKGLVGGRQAAGDGEIESYFLLAGTIGDEGQKKSRHGELDLPGQIDVISPGQAFLLMAWH